MNIDSEGNNICTEKEKPDVEFYSTKVLMPIMDKKFHVSKQVYIKIRDRRQVFYTRSFHSRMGWDAGGIWFWSGVEAWAPIPQGA